MTGRVGLLSPSGSYEISLEMFDENVTVPVWCRRSKLDSLRKLGRLKVGDKLVRQLWRCRSLSISQPGREAGIFIIKI
jgi:hypothetical protein